MPQLRVVKTDDLVIDPDIQLEFTVNESHWRRIARDYDSEAVGVIVACPLPSGKLGIIDGRHRFKAGVSRAVKEWRVDVHTDITSRAAKAALKLKLDRDRRNVGALEHFIERQMAGEERAVTIGRVVAEVGFEIGKCKSGRPYTRIEAVGALDRIYSSLGADGVRRTLILNTHWRDEPKTNTRYWLSALSLLVRDGYDEAMTPNAWKRWDGLVPAVVLRKAQGEIAASGGMTNGGGSADSTGAVAYAIASVLRKKAGLRPRPATRPNSKASNVRPV